MAAPLRLRQGMAHQVAADAALAEVGCHRQRSEQQRGPPATSHDVPKPHGADQEAARAGDKRQALRRPLVLAQPLGGLAEAGIPERSIEQRLAACDIEGGLLTNCDHGGASASGDALRWLR